MKTLDQLREELDAAIFKYSCAEMIDSFTRMREERARWKAQMDRLEKEIAEHPDNQK